MCSYVVDAADVRPLLIPSATDHMMDSAPISRFVALTSPDKIITYCNVRAARAPRFTGLSGRSAARTCQQERSAGGGRGG